VPPHKTTVATLNWYEKRGENLLGEEPLSGISEAELLKIFDAPFWNGIYQCWSLEPGQMPMIQPHVDHHLEPSKYLYFVELMACEE